jgi:hypothetical protein
MPSSIDNPAMAAARWWCPRHIVVTVEGPEGPRGDVVITKPFARLGRDQRAEIELADASVLPCQVYLHATAEGLYCTGFAAGSQGGWLLPSTTFEVGPFRVRASLADFRPPAALPPDPQSKGTAGPRVPRIRMYTDKSRATHTDLLLQRRLTLIGRQTPATWRIKHPTISRAHGAVVWDGADLWLIDFFSSNGTRLGENRCDAGLVRPGQEFRIGTIACCYLDVLPAVGASTGDQAAGAGDFSDSQSTRRPSKLAFDRQEDDTAQEHRVDGPRPQDEMVAPPHATPGSGLPKALPPDLASPPPRATPAPSADVPAPAALVETRPLTGDTKFVDRPQRPLEERAMAAELELAAQRESAATRAARVDSELLALRQEFERLEAALRQERDSHRDHRAQVAELRERVLRDVAQIGEQTQLLRQACDARPWEGSLARLADDTVRRCAELERQIGEGLQSAAQKLATVEGTMIAKVAELRSRQDGLGEKRPVAAGDDPENVLSVEPLAGTWESSQGRPREMPAPVEHAPDGAPRTSRSPWRAAEDARPISIEAPAASGTPAADGSPQWLLGEEFTHRLADLNAKRERSDWQRRLLWTGVALVSALVIVLAASLLRFWLHPNQGAEGAAASGKPEAKASQEKPSPPQEPEPAPPDAD